MLFNTNWLCTYFNVNSITNAEEAAGFLWSDRASHPQAKNLKGHIKCSRTAASVNLNFPASV